MFKSGKLDLRPVITDRIALKDFSQGMERLKTGEASKILVYPNGTRQSRELPTCAIVQGARNLRPSLHCTGHVVLRAFGWRLTPLRMTL